MTVQNYNSKLADSALVSTTADLNRFLRALVRGDLLDPPQLAEMLRTRPAVPGHDGQPGFDHGLGIMRTPLTCGGTTGTTPATPSATTPAPASPRTGSAASYWS